MRICQRVEINGGMSEFIGKLGTVIDNTERDGRTVMNRVKLDTPVYIEGVGEVADDLWSGSLLKRVK